jgi:hypothetical protein
MNWNLPVWLGDKDVQQYQRDVTVFLAKRWQDSATGGKTALLEDGVHHRGQ